MPGYTPEMGRCILALYRSAAQPPRSRPGQAIMPTDASRPVAKRWPVARPSGRRARMAVLAGLGHWWMCQDPRRGAETLGACVARLEG